MRPSVVLLAQLLALGTVAVSAGPAAGDEPAAVRLEAGTTFEAGDRIVRSLSYSPDGARLAAGSSDRRLRIFDPAMPGEVSSVELRRYG